MRILAFDTAADFCCVVLMIGDRVTARRLVMTARDQAKILAPLTQDVLTEQGLSAEDIDRFAIASGPGSFTGLRVGLAFARGLGLATEKPVLGFDHFACMRHAIKTDTGLLMVRDSKRAELFACWRAPGKEAVPFLATAKNLAEMAAAEKDAALCGDGTSQLAALMPELSPRILTIPPESCAISAAQLAGKTADTRLHPPEPVYLREADVTMPRIPA